MRYERFVDGQRRGVNFISKVVICLVCVLWLATFFDWAFDMGWGWDRQILWLGPSMVLFTLLLRLCAMAVFKFVDNNY
ncbi:hypothetical protein NS319_00385 [Sphingomonas sanguinis]|uniref:Uncharacterized protein n=1 Tax=Sphingomonas sanguinis TaxID=33051 RepID=A0A147I8Z1_9SPHN|nr:hypothetical protein NS319_00385 [Sphingomonas sanguinis]